MSNCDSHKETRVKLDQITPDLPDLCANTIVTIVLGPRQPPHNGIVYPVLRVNRSAQGGIDGTARRRCLRGGKAGDVRTGPRHSSQGGTGK